MTPADTPPPAPPLPTEPGPFGIVIDRYRMVWQRFGPGWYSPLRPLVMLGAPAREWPDLVRRRGPVKVLSSGGGPSAAVIAGADHAALEVAAFADTGLAP